MTYESRRICFWSKTGILQRRAAPTLWNCCVAVANGSYNFGLRLRCGRSVSRKTCGPGWGLGSQMREIAPARSEMFEACQMREIRPSSQESSELSRAPAWRHRLAPPVTWPSGRDTGRGLASDPIFNAVLRAAALLACCFVGNSYDESRAGRVIYVCVSRCGPLLVVSVCSDCSRSAREARGAKKMLSKTTRAQNFPRLCAFAFRRKHAKSHGASKHAKLPRPASPYYPPMRVATSNLFKKHSSFSRPARPVVCKNINSRRLVRVSLTCTQNTRA